MLIFGLKGLIERKYKQGVPTSCFLKPKKRTKRREQDDVALEYNPLTIVKTTNSM